MAWNPDVYNKFKQERFGPFYDLIRLVKVKPALQAIDLGCGTGELTRKLADALPGSTVLGIDSSQEMLNDAAAFQNEQLSFKKRTIEEQLGSGEKYDLLFSNAAIQWLSNHQALYPQIISTVKPGGQLVVQIPSNHRHFTHTTLIDIASTPPFSEVLKGFIRVSPVMDIEEYAKLFFQHGGTEITVYEKIYPHVLKDADALFDWVSGTAMIPYVEKLPEDVRQSFIATYKERLRNEFKGSPVFYPFKRTIMAATF
ncbi:trans-aconitate 2-methyltransferase [Pedobacter cryoconitis]|uniref:methyltransferase domain-containing protein n=1 Tax=Pedobacter cryoconitis TaxID=188932 RepID=UPI001619E74A|nr:methyltransferase domain-containing protein [Pedobacter cryoconitis]MBB6270629.1 trans-aconitate 2-methyltransferase [Pedobacter cryoconitis]